MNIMRGPVDAALAATRRAGPDAVADLLRKFGVERVVNLRLCDVLDFENACEKLTAPPSPKPHAPLPPTLPKPVFAIGERVKRGTREGVVVGYELRYHVQRDGSKFTIPYKGSHLTRVEPKPAPSYKRDFDIVYAPDGRRVALFNDWHEAERFCDAMNAYVAPK